MLFFILNVFEVDLGLTIYELHSMKVYSYILLLNHIDWELHQNNQNLFDMIQVDTLRMFYRISQRD